MLYKRNSSFIGDLIVVILIVLALFLVLNQINTKKIEKIQKINQEFNIKKDNLLSKNQEKYITNLEKINLEKITNPIIEYNNIVKRARDINRSLNLSILQNKKCIKKDLSLEINSYLIDKKRLLEEFKNQDSKKLDKIYWDKYIESLRETTSIQEISNAIKTMPVC